MRREKDKKSNGIIVLLVLILIVRLVLFLIPEPEFPSYDTGNKTGIRTEKKEETTTQRKEETTTEASTEKEEETATEASTKKEEETTKAPSTERKEETTTKEKEETAEVSKRYGTASSLDGKTVLVSVFVNDAKMNWDYNSNTEVETMYYTIDALKTATDWISDNTARWGAKTEFFYDWSKDNALFYLMNTDRELLDYLSSTSGSEIKTDHNYMRDYISKNIDSQGLMNKYNADNIGYLFIFDTPIEGDYRSYAHWWYSGVAPEYCFIAASAFDRRTEPAIYAHEILHMFGANDLYYSNDKITEDYVNHCKETNSNDIMYNTYDITGALAPDRVTNEFTELDAYYTGLTNESKTVKKWGLGKSIYVD